MVNLILAFALLIAGSSSAEIMVPSVVDTRLEIALVASEPAIVTPIGMVVDGRDRLFVVESHTHQTKPDYPGPKHDRVKLFQDTTGDGQRNKVSIFADELTFAMNLTFGPDSKLYLSHRNGVIILHDTDGDGVSEARSVVLEMDTPETYPHNGISGIAFSPDGWLYVGLGENLSQKYTLKGTDGSLFSGGGEGGNIFRCRPNGSDLQYVATGFWNPFDLAFDRSGHLFCVDNDPDSSPPCRLLHIVPQGDYGYKRRFGRSGLHPFVAWNGELPGTLPMVAGTGEAPSGILDCDQARLPAAYHGTLLITSWGDNRIERFRPRPHGASLRAERDIIVQGDKAFWPVAIAAGPNGDVYITDWADREYPVHRKGRIWKLRAKPEVDASRLPAQRQVLNTEAGRMHRLLAAEAREGYADLLAALADPDPFIRAAAVSALAKPIYRSDVLRDLGHDKPEIRLGALLALRRAKYAGAIPVLRRCLADSDEQVRLMALVWIGEEALTPLANDLETALTAGGISPPVFHAYLAASGVLARVDAKTGQAKPVSTGIPGASGSGLIETLVRDASKPASLRALAVAMVSNPDDEKLLGPLVKLARDGEPVLRAAAIRTLAASTHRQVVSVLESTARDRKNTAELRADAVLALAGQPAERLATLVDLLDDPARAVRIETARALRQVADHKTIRTALRRRFDSVRDRPEDAAMTAQLRLALFPPGAASEDPTAIDPSRPTTDEQWRTTLARGGDARAGRRVFFHPLTACSKCHRVGGRGGQVGPDLSTIARSSDREKLITSILTPSKDMAPKFVPHVVRSEDGDVYVGLLASRAPDGAITLTTAAAETVTIPAKRIADHRTQPTSLMPDEIENALTTEGFRDLIAFLLTLK